MEECLPAGFESHWDAEWFKRRAEECRRLASLAAEESVRDGMLELARTLKRQSDHAAILAAIASVQQTEGGLLPPKPGWKQRP